MAANSHSPLFKDNMSLIEKGLEKFHSFLMKHVKDPNNIQIEEEYEHHLKNYIDIITYAIKTDPDNTRLYNLALGGIAGFTKQANRNLSKSGGKRTRKSRTRKSRKNRRSTRR